MKWLQKIFLKSSQTPVPLRGRPAIRREKSYSARTGYVYQYFYEGFCKTHIENTSGQVYYFSVSSDRVSHFPVRIFLSQSTLFEWQTTRQRELNATEQYALIKMSLFAVFDQNPKLTDGMGITVISYQEIDKYAKTLEFV